MGSRVTVCHALSRCVTLGLSEGLLVRGALSGARTHDLSVVRRVSNPLNYGAVNRTDGQVALLDAQSAENELCVPDKDNR